MIKGIIFDFEGPIMDMGDPDILQDYSLRKGLDRGAMYRVMHRYFDGAHVGEFKDFTDFYTKENPKEFTLEEFKEALDAYNDSRGINGRTVNLIRELKTRYKIGLFSNFDNRLGHYLEEFGITNLFDVVINSHELKAEKPDEVAFRRALEKFGMRPEEVIFIDDKSGNIEGAERMGIKSIHFRNFDQMKTEIDELIKA